MSVWFTEWLPVIGVALLSGVFNLIIAYTKFNRDIRSPFFTPWKSLGFWLWLLLQLTIPAIIFWFVFGPTVRAIPSPTDSKIITHEITTDLVTKSIVFGMGFTAFVNANIDLGFAGISLADFCKIFIKISYQIIAKKENRKLVAFSNALELEQSNIDIPAGTRYLRKYFEIDFALKLNPIEQLKMLDRLIQAGTDSKALASLILEVRNDCLYDALTSFKCTDPFCKKYFP